MFKQWINPKLKRALFSFPLNLSPYLHHFTTYSLIPPKLHLFAITLESLTKIFSMLALVFWLKPLIICFAILLAFVLSFPNPEVWLKITNDIQCESNAKLLSFSTDMTLYSHFKWDTVMPNRYFRPLYIVFKLVVGLDRQFSFHVIAYASPKKIEKVSSFHLLLYGTITCWCRNIKSTEYWWWILIESLNI